MSAGPLFHRDLITQPRHTQHYLLRVGYIFLFMLLLYTASQATFGWQQYRSIQARANFGSMVFQLFSLVQLTLVIFLSLLYSANNIAQEKDRRTFDLLLLTDLRNYEIVFGKLLGSLLPVYTMIICSIPVFVGVYTLGGITLLQVISLLILCAVGGLAAGSWGTLVGLWRDKTFQTLAISLLGFIMLIAVTEGLAQVLPPALAEFVGVLNPYNTLFKIVNPFSYGIGNANELQNQMFLGMLGCIALSAILCTISVIMLRVWNPVKTVFIQVDEDKGQISSNNVKHRHIWEKPILWREVITRAYGRKMIFIKLAYLLIASFICVMIFQLLGSESLVLGMIHPSGFLLIALCLMGMLLINAQAVTSITTERDGQTLELLLVTDITSTDFVYGKLGGIFWNTKETILLPIGIILSMCVMEYYSVEAAIFVSLGYLVLCVFSAVLGIHSALSFFRSKTAIGNSLGTMFFLFIGIFICMMLIVEARSSFMLQLPSFLVFILGGSLGLGYSLTYKNPSSALNLAAGILPFLTFYAITAYLLGGSLDVFLAISFAYGFTVLAMLIPAISEFDAALGRTTTGK